MNGGKHGVPIIDSMDGTVIGIVTQRRFLGATEVRVIGRRSEQLRQNCNSIAGRRSVQLMGINFVEIANRKVIPTFKTNNPIEYGVEECKKLNLL